MNKGNIVSQLPACIISCHGYDSYFKYTGLVLKSYRYRKKGSYLALIPFNRLCGSKKERFLWPCCAADPSYTSDATKCIWQKTRHSLCVCVDDFWRKIGISLRCCSFFWWPRPLSWLINATSIIFSFSFSSSSFFSYREKCMMSTHLCAHYQHYAMLPKNLHKNVW